MHAALLVDEIVALVASHVLGSHSQALSPRTRPDTSSTLGLALTRRSFLNPVCNVMWRRLDSLRPLLALIPTSTNADELSRGWDRYFTYANRVRHLTSDDPEDAEALTHFVLSWRSAAPGSHSVPPSPTSPRGGPSYLTPYLHSLHITIGSAQAMHVLPSLLPPSLLLLDLHVAHPPPTPTTPGRDGGLAYFQALSRCTRLQHWAVCTDWAHDQLPPEIHSLGTEVLTSLRSLRTLALDVPVPFTPQLLDSLRRLPDLEDLRLFVFSASTSTITPLHNRDSTSNFGALHSLILSGPVHVQLACLQALPVIPTLTSTELITSDPADIPMDTASLPLEADADMMDALDRALRALGPNAAHEVRSPSWEELSEDSDLDDFEAAAVWNARGYSSVAILPQSIVPVAGGGGVQVH